MALNKVRMLCSDISHMPLHTIFRHSGVTEKYGFELEVDIANLKTGDSVIKMSERAPGLLTGKYEFLSGLHHETYIYRAKGDKRLVYLAQTQNDWDDRLIARPEIKFPKQLEGKRILTGKAPCVGGNLEQSLKRAGVDTSQVELVYGPRERRLQAHEAVEMVARGEVDAANVDIPFDLQGRKKGLNVIQLPALPVIHNTTICANMDYVLKNEDTVIAFLKALIEAIHFFKTEKQKSRALLKKHLVPLLHLEGDDEVDYLHDQWSKLLSAKPYPHPLAVWNVYDLDVGHDPKVNFIGPLEIWDTHYLRIVDDSGFIDGLYGQSARA
ncbi:MAG TPA: ABC transporter substrate-binding protein [Candidatus Binatia bacterium]|jgi:Txe/YoeB family toxin of Txe-Axe toxin-antitoxin module